MASNHEALRRHADELRRRAADVIGQLRHFSDPEIRARMEEIAANYEKIATQLDQLAEYQARLALNTGD